MTANRHDRRRLAARQEQPAPTPPLLKQLWQADRALRDAMPVFEWLNQAMTSFSDGAYSLASERLSRALGAFQSVPSGSPLIHAYLRWLEENARVAKGTSEAIGEPNSEDPDDDDEEPEAWVGERATRGMKGPIEG